MKNISCLAWNEKGLEVSDFEINLSLKRQSNEKEAKFL